MQSNLWITLTLDSSEDSIGSRSIDWAENLNKQPSPPEPRAKALGVILQYQTLLQNQVDPHILDSPILLI